MQVKAKLSATDVCGSKKNDIGEFRMKHESRIFALIKVRKRIPQYPV